jgi:ribonucleoside-diphosphate reductase alpha chain
MAVAPTGTISLLPEVTSSIEPLFLKAYLRSDRVSDRMYVHPVYKEALANGTEKEIEDWYVDTDDLEPADHFETQAIVQKYVDGAISKTINMPADTTPDELSDLMLEYIYDLKGVTVYIDKSREGQILNRVSEKEVREHVLEDKEITEDMMVAQCAGGSCDM